MLKVDIPIVKEFFGSTDDIVSLITPFKHCRLYAKKNGMANDIIFVITPMIETTATDVIANLKKAGAKRYERKGKYVYSLIEKH